MVLWLGNTHSFMPLQGRQTSDSEQVYKKKNSKQKKTWKQSEEGFEQLWSEGAGKTDARARHLSRDLSRQKAGGRAGAKARTQ